MTMSHEEDVLDQDETEIAEVRAARHRISERVGHDAYRLVAYYMDRQKEGAKPPGRNDSLSRQLGDPERR
jgi:hypothetical protein